MFLLIFYPHKGNPVSIFARDFFRAGEQLFDDLLSWPGCDEPIGVHNSRVSKVLKDGHHTQYVELFGRERISAITDVRRGAGH